MNSLLARRSAGNLPKPVQQQRSPPQTGSLTSKDACLVPSQSNRDVESGNAWILRSSKPHMSYLGHRNEPPTLPGHGLARGTARAPGFYRWARIDRRRWGVDRWAWVDRRAWVDWRACGVDRWAWVDWRAWGVDRRAWVDRWEWVDRRGWVDWGFDRWPWVNCRAWGVDRWRAELSDHGCHVLTVHPRVGIHRHPQIFDQTADLCRDP